MSLYHDIKYIQMLSPNLEKFRHKSEYVWTFRCPICGDSAKNKNKTRGYVYKNKSDLFFKCHNCGASMTIGSFLKVINNVLYKQYVLERYAAGETGRKPHSKPKFEEYKPKSQKPKIDLPNIIELPMSHYAHKYLIDRKIPDEYLSLFYFAEDFQSWAIKVTNGEYKQKYHTDTTDPRIVIPFYDSDKKLIAIQARALLPTGLRYITLKFNEDSPKIFGLERWTPNKTTYITEGPFDALFIPNALAMAGSSVDISVILSEVEKKEIVYIFDNESRNKEIVRLMLAAASKGYSVSLWKETNTIKDINDMILSGRTKENILAEIQDNTVDGLKAILAINSWKKCP